MINIYYRYSELDKEHQYSVDQSDGNNTFFAWIWFYLGQTKLGKLKGKIYFVPFVQHGHKKIIKSYTYNFEAKTIAGFISNFVVKHYKKQISRKAIKK